MAVLREALLRGQVHAKDGYYFFGSERLLLFFIQYCFSCSLLYVPLIFLFYVFLPYFYSNSSATSPCLRSIHLVLTFFNYATLLMHLENTVFVETATRITNSLSTEDKPDLLLLPLLVQAF